MRRLTLPAIAVGYWSACLAVAFATGVKPVAAREAWIMSLVAPLHELMRPVHAAFLKAIDGLPSFGGELISGLVTGDTSRVSSELTESMKTTSLTHLTAVSGANCQVIVLAAMSILTALKLSRGLRILGALCALIAFVSFVEPQTSVVRAAVMSMAVLVGLMCGRLQLGLPTLALTVVVLLAIEPSWAVDYGFALSVLATAGILLLTEPVATFIQSHISQRSQIPESVTRKICLVIAVPVAATLLCQPVLVLLNPYLPTYGILANILAEPAAALATVTGLFTAASAVLWLPLGELAAWFTWLPAQFIGAIAHLLSNMPISQIDWMSGLPGGLCSALISGVTIFLVMRKRDTSRYLKAILLSILVGVIGFATLSTIHNYVQTSATVPTNWSIATCDVGQGDAIVLRTNRDAEQQFVLIDTGPSPAVLSECLEYLHVKHLDMLVITHYDLDHVGGIDAVIDKTDRALIGTAENPADTFIERQIVARIENVSKARAGMTGHIGGVRWSVLWPDGHTPTMQSGNPGSVAMLWSVDGISLVSLADLGEVPQDTLSSHFIDLPHVDVLKVAHHGSADTSATFIRRLHPKVALVSVGAHNGYGHPTQRALQVLRGLGSQVMRTDTQGTIFVSAVSGNILVSSQR